MNIYEFQDYRKFLNTWIANQANKGHGIKGAMAIACGVSSSMISLVLKGEKELSMEQAAEVSDYIGLNERESDYFMLLVNFGRSGTHKLQNKLLRKIQQQQELAKKVSFRIKKDISLSDEVKAIYYSSWIYTGIRNLTALDEINGINDLSRRLHLPSPIVSKAVDFLLEHGLCKKVNGKLTYGPAHTHMNSDSPYVAKHHQNWRIRGFTFMDIYNESNLFFTCPMSLSAEAADQIRKELPYFIEGIQKQISASSSEKVYCLNIDWFEY